MLIFAAMILGLVLLAWVSFQNRYILNPDGVAYISIAEHYANGDIKAAVNAYWSPLLSWLMAPLVLLGFGGQAAFIIINFLAGCFLLFFGSLYIYRTSGWRPMAIYFACMLPFTTYLMTTQITPDILVLVWILLGVGVFSFANKRLKKDSSLPQLLKLSLLLGFFGFLGYMTKLFLQPVFVVAVLGFTILFLWRLPIKWKQGLIFVIATFGCYGLFCLSWIVPLSIKYDQLTLGSSYAFNSIPGRAQNDLFASPPHEKAVTAWEDPTFLIDEKRASATASNESQTSRIEKIYKNLPAYLQKVNDLWVFLFVPVFGALVYIVSRKKRGLLDEKISMSLLLFSVYLATYTLVGGPGNSRYQWPLLLLSIILVAWLCGEIWQRKLKEKNFQHKLALFCLAILLPLTLFLEYTPYPSQLLQEKSIPELQFVAEHIRERHLIPENSRIVASDFLAATHLSYYLQAKSYGVIRLSTRPSEQKQTYQHLQAQGIDYIIDISQGEKQYGKKAQLLYESPLQNYCESSCSLRVVAVP